jgi:hypothetical protein
MRSTDIVSFCLSVLGLYGLAFYIRLLLPRNVIPQVSTALNEVEALLGRAETLNAIYLPFFFPSVTAVPTISVAEPAPPPVAVS